MISKENDREIRGYSILAKGDKPIAISKEEFLVPSQSSNTKYRVSHLDGWTCECKDFKYRNQLCKHIHAIQFWLKLRSGIDSSSLMEIEGEVAKENCPYCKSSKIVKNGSRKTKAGTRQRYKCEDCKKRFVLEPIKHFKGTSKIITLTLDLYFKGLSYRDITDTIFQFYGLELHHETVRRWITRFTQVMNNYVNKLTPKVSEAWHVDEQAVKVKGKYEWCWNALDEETRFLIANNITKERTMGETREIFAKTKAITKTNPEFIITDGLPSYKEAIIKEFHSWRKPQVNHVRLESIRNKRINNNLVERYHSTFRERDKVMRGFKSEQTTKNYADSFKTYYNFIRPHQALNGKTPSQKANLDLKLDRNRWLSLLKKSIENKSETV